MKVKRFNLGTSSVNVELGDADTQLVSTWVIQVTGTIGTGTIAVKGYVNGAPIAGRPGTDTTLTALAVADSAAIPYYGAAGTVVSGATTISTLGVYRIVASGVSVRLEYTAGGGSDLVVHAKPLCGVAQ
jgi:hypothetical protein